MTAGGRVRLKLHLGWGSTLVPAWENIDKSPSLLLARVPGLRRGVAAARILTPDQAESRDRAAAKLVRPGVLADVELKARRPLNTSLVSSRVEQGRARDAVGRRGGGSDAV